jgi:hypothetical protein
MRARRLPSACAPTAAATFLQRTLLRSYTPGAMEGGEMHDEDRLDDLEATKMIVRLVRPELTECEVAAAAEVGLAHQERDRREGVDFRSLDRPAIRRRIVADCTEVEAAIASCRKRMGLG